MDYFDAREVGEDGAEESADDLDELGENQDTPRSSEVGLSVRHQEEAQAHVGLHGSRASQARSCVLALSSTGHLNNVADMRPCMSRSDCGLSSFPCDNVVRRDHHRECAHHQKGATAAHGDSCSLRQHREA